MAAFDRRENGKLRRRIIPKTMIALSLLHVMATVGYSMQAAFALAPGLPAESEVKLTVRTHGGQAVFQIGEVIHLELSFVTTVPNKYQLATTPYNRWIEWHNLEGIEIQPQLGWDDPLDLYFRSRKFEYFDGTGLSAMPEEISTEPTVVLVELTEWVRFKDPGQYRVALKSGRVSKLRLEPGTEGAERVTVRSNSNELLLTIVPASKEWQQQTLKDALAILDDPESAAYPFVSDAQRTAAKALRRLGTAAAAHAMAQRWNDRGLRSEFTLGLVGSPAREAALDEMKALLVDPNFPVDRDFLTTMSVLALAQDTTEKEPALRIELETHFRRELKLALETKRGQARAVSMNTLLEPPQ
jgi:hypothetical protein